MQRLLMVMLLASTMTGITGITGILVAQDMPDGNSNSSGCCFPDAPSAVAQGLQIPSPEAIPQLPPPPVPPVPPVATCGRFHWSCWPYNNVPTREVIKDKALWLTFGGDVALTLFDDSMTEWGLRNTPCEEKNIHPPRPTTWQVYRSGLPENAAVWVGSFIWLKIKGPKWVMPMFLGYPAVVHIKDGVSWIGCGYTYGK